MREKTFNFTKILMADIPKDAWTKTMRMTKASQNGIIRISIGRILTKINIPKENYKGLVIQKYNDVMESREIYYVKIPRLKKPTINEVTH